MGRAPVNNTSRRRAAIRVLVLSLTAVAAVVALVWGLDSTDAVAPSTTALPGSPTTTSVPASSTTTSTTLAPIWTGDVETGDTSQWYSISVSGQADAEVVEDPVHSGSYSIKLINSDVDGTHNAGVRLNLQGPFGPDPRNLPDEAYYSVWYLIPFPIHGQSNVFQFKQSDVTERDQDGNPVEHTRRNLWKLSTVPSDDGTTDLEVATRIDQTSGRWHQIPERLALLDVDLPIGTWFQIEVFYRFGMDGRTTVWLDGEEIWDWEGPTEASDLVCLHRCREWVVSHYLGDWQGPVEPRDSWIFVDDAAVTSDRRGTAAP